MDCDSGREGKTGGTNSKAVLIKRCHIYMYDLYSINKDSFKLAMNALNPQKKNPNKLLFIFIWCYCIDNQQDWNSDL